MANANVLNTALREAGYTPSAMSAAEKRAAAAELNHAAQVLAEDQRNNATLLSVPNVRDYLDRSMTSMSLAGRCKALRGVNRVLEWSAVSALVWELRNSRTGSAGETTPEQEAGLEVVDAGELGGLFGDTEYDGIAEAKLARMADATQLVLPVKYLRAGVDQLSAGLRRAMPDQAQFYPASQPLPLVAKRVAEYKSKARLADDEKDAAIRAADEASRSPAEQRALARAAARKESKAKAFGQTVSVDYSAQASERDGKYVAEEADYVLAAFEEVPLRAGTDYLPDEVWSELPVHMQYRCLTAVFDAAADDRKALGFKRLGGDSRLEDQYEAVCALIAELADLIDELMAHPQVQLWEEMEAERESK